jgi:adenylosuccinate lyase
MMSAAVAGTTSFRPTSSYTTLRDVTLAWGRVTRGMVVHADRTRENIELSYVALSSQRTLLEVVESGTSREPDRDRVRGPPSAWKLLTALRRATLRG